jgi:hypothetical protein
MRSSFVTRRRASARSFVCAVAARSEFSAARPSCVARSSLSGADRGVRQEVPDFLVHSSTVG